MKLLPHLIFYFAFFYDPFAPLMGTKFMNIPNNYYKRSKNFISSQFRTYAPIDQASYNSRISISWVTWAQSKDCQSFLKGNLTIAWRPHSNVRLTPKMGHCFLSFYFYWKITRILYCGKYFLDLYMIIF